MRLNKYIAHFYGLSRREADDLISAGKAKIDNKVAILGAIAEEGQQVDIEGYSKVTDSYVYLMLNKPIGYVCSRNAQDSAPTIYELLPEEYQNLKTVGRIDKDSSGLILFTNDGDFAQEMTHPKNQKLKVYLTTLEKPMTENDLIQLNKGVDLKDGASALDTQIIAGSKYKVVMSEGRNRQVRRTFGQLGYTVTKLKRVEFGDYKLNDLAEGSFTEVNLR